MSTRLHFVKKARKAYRKDGIKKGQSYYWWKFRYGGKQRSLKKPRASQLTQSPYEGALCDMRETLDDCELDESAIREAVESVAEELRNLAEECRSNKENMPDSLQESDTGQLLEDRAESCESAADELDNIDVEPFGEERDNYDSDDEYDEARDEHWTNALQEAQDVLASVE